MSSLRFGWYNFRPSHIQFFNSPKWLLVFLCLYFFSLSMVINGTYSVSVSTIEKRFGLSSSVMGWVTSMYDVACLLVTAFVSYYGGQQSKAKWLGGALMLLGVANFVFILPHFIIGGYDAGKNHLPDICGKNVTNMTETDCQNQGIGEWYHPALFCFGMFLIGIAGAPLYVLGVVFLDESVKRKVAPVYIGIFGASGTLGSACGILLGGIFLSMFVDAGVKTGMTPSDPRWIGNWWIGNVIGIGFSIFLSIWMLGFPRKIARKDENSLNQDSGSDESHIFQFSELINQVDVGKIASVTKELFSIPGYIFLCIGSSLEYFVITAALAFFPKVIYVLYNTPLSELSWLYGLGVALPILAGQILGAYINKRLDLDGIQATKTVCVMTFLSLVVGAFYATTDCPGQEIVGINGPAYLNKTSVNMIINCNIQCDCKNWFYFPVCDRLRKTTYRSPCIARCENKQEKEKIFSGCRCSASEELAYGKCPSDCSSKAAVFVLLAALFGFTSFLAQTPTVIALLRSVPNHLKAYSLGWQMTFVRLFGAIPGPIIYGRLIDTTCILWQNKCGNRGNCLEYDNKKLIYITTALAVVVKFLTTLFFGLAWKCLKPPPRTMAVNGNETIHHEAPDSERDSSSPRESARSDTTLIRSEV